VGLASWEVRGERGTFDWVPQPLLFEIVLMTLSPARRIASLHEETFQFFVHLEDVVRISCLGDNNVSSLYVLR
jgi:hypothetical protein